MTQDTALDILKIGVPVFLTGEPGAGKTHTINRYIAYLSERGVTAAVTASTGIAATHVSGMTIHSWSGIGIKKRLTPYELDQLSSNERVVKRISGTKVLIIDEISMLDGEVLNTVNAVCKAARRSEEPFGGMQVIFVGDFFQLPPVVRRGEAPSTFAFQSSAWKEANPVVCYLSEQYRQSDERYLSLLGAIRRNEIDETHHYTLQERYIGALEEEIPEGITRLYAHNADVDRINQEELGKLSGDRHNFLMQHKGSRTIAESLARGCLSPGELTLTEGAKVMCTKNDPAGDFVNGTLGTVVSFAKSDRYPIIETDKGERLKITPTEWSVEEQGKVRAQIIQVPLRLAWAITVHKSQGISLSHAAIDLTHAFEYGQGYVALSRVRTLSGLYLHGYNPRALEVHPEILAEDRVLRTRSNAAEKRIEEMPEEEVATLQRNFLQALGGKEPDPKAPKVSKKKQVAPSSKDTTLGETLRLLKEGKDISSIAHERAMAESTVWGHLEKLKVKGLLKKKDIAHITKPIPKKQFKEIEAVFLKHGTEKLRPIFEELSEQYPWETLRIVRLSFYV